MLPVSPKKPTNLMHALEFFSTINVEGSSSYGPNITVQSLRQHGLDDQGHYERMANLDNDFQAMIAAQSATYKQNQLIRKIEDAFSKWNIQQFVPLITRSMEANVAVAMYAGDGIVAKITKGTEFGGSRPMAGVYTPLPGVLPPIASVNVDGYVVEVFPWVDTQKITQGDVEKMSAFLAERNLQFYEKDAKPNNIGRLPNGELVILDGHAIGVKDTHKPVPTHETNAWQDKIYRQFRPLYEMSDLSKLVRDKPDFSLSFSPLLERGKPQMQDVRGSRTVDSVPPGQVPEQVKKRFNWFGLRRGGAGGGHAGE